MHCTVRFFGPAVELTGVSERRYELPADSTVGALAMCLANDYPKLGAALGVRLAVNRAYVPLSAPLSDGDEIAVIPPVSGG